MDATQVISDSILESDEEENEEEDLDRRGRPLAKLCILKNQHIPETELPLYLGDNVLGRESGTCTLTLPAASVSKQHATISISVYRRRGCHSDADVETLVWDLGSMNGTRKGRLKLTPHVRYALTEGESLVVADIPCQYVSYGADLVSSQDNTRTPGSRNALVKDRLADATGEKWGDTTSGNKQCVNGDTKARGSFQKTPVRGTCLSFEQTPIQPQGSLVPESDTDSDSERREGGDKRRQAFASDSDSHKFSPSSSSFLSPPNKTVPESEDESPIRPSSSTGKRSYRHVSFSKEETDADAGRQQLEKKKSPAVTDDGEEEEDGAAAAAGGANSKDSRQHDKKDASLRGENKLPVSTSDVSRDAIPAFNMDSDTDVEGEEEEVVPAGPLHLNTNQQAAQPPNTALFHMDSDTDDDEDEDVADMATKTPPSSNDTTRLSRVASVIQPEGITIDSDTDVDDDDDNAVSDAATTVKATSCQSAQTADSASSVLAGGFHLDSDTDVEEEEDEGTKSKISETHESPTISDKKLVLHESDSAAPQNLRLDSITDEKAIPVPLVIEPSVAAVVSESCATTDAGAEMNIPSDSDTDVEDDFLLDLPAVVPNVSAAPATVSEEPKSDSDADTDVDAGGVNIPTDRTLDSDTDVDDKEADIVKTGEDLISELHREITPVLPVSLLQNCSTPVQASSNLTVFRQQHLAVEGQVEEMETQAFTIPSSGAFRLGAAPSNARSVVSPSCSDSQEEDFVVAETQSFVLQTPGCQLSVESTQTSTLESSGNKSDEQCSRGYSFQLGLSDSSHLQCRGGSLAVESTQAFVSVEGGVNLEETQAYAAISAAGESSAENDSHVEATQAYVEEEPARCSEVSEKQGCVDLALEATQAYISQLCNDSDQKSEEKGQNAASAQLSDSVASATLAMTETQPMFSFVGENSLETNRAENESEERDARGKTAYPQERHLTEAQPIAEAQHMHRSENELTNGGNSSSGRQEGMQLDNEQAQPHTCSVSSSTAETQVVCEGDQTDEDSMVVPRKRKAKQLHFEEEETQQLQHSVVSLTETQPIAASEDDDDADLMLGSRKSKAMQLTIEDEDTQQPTNSELSLAETQPIGANEDDDDDDGDSVPGSRRRKAKMLKFEDETQSLVGSEVSAIETQPLDVAEVEQSEEEDLIPCPRKRKAKTLQFDDESQSLVSSEVSTVETQPVVTGDEDLFPGPRKRKAKQLCIVEEDTQQLTNSEVSTAETQPTATSHDENADLTPGPQQNETKPLKLEEEQKQILATTEVSAMKTGSVLTDKKNDEDSTPGPKKRKAKQLHLEDEETRALTNSEVLSETSDVSAEKEMKMRARKKEDEVACSAPPDRRTRRESTALASTRGRRGRDKSDDNNEEEVKQSKQTGGSKMTRQQKDDKADKRTRNANQSLIKGEKDEKIEEKPGGVELRQQERDETEKGRNEINGKEREEKERLEKEKSRLEMERKEQERKEMAQKERQQREKQEREQQARLEKEKEAKEKQLKESQQNKDVDEPNIPVRGRRATTRTITAQCAPEPDSTIKSNEDFPAARTRSRSNSSNSVSSERSAPSVSTQESKGRGRGRGMKRGSEPPQTSTARNRRRITVAEGAVEQNRIEGLLSRANSSNSASSEVSSCSISSQTKGRGGRQRGRRRKTEHDPDTIVPVFSQTNQSSTAEGRRNGKAEESAEEAGTSRGQQQANAHGSEPTILKDEGQEHQPEGHSVLKSTPPKRNVRGRGQKAAKTETVEKPVAAKVNDINECSNRRIGKKDELEANPRAEPAKVSRQKESIRKTEAATAEEEKEEIPATVKAKKTGRASSTPAKRKSSRKSFPEEEVKDAEKVQQETVEKKSRGRSSVVQREKNEEREDSGTSSTPTDKDTNMDTSEIPLTPVSRFSRKRQGPTDSPSVAKTPRSTSASPLASGRLRAGGQDYKVLFTGVVDEAGERVLARLGASMAKGVADMNCLVTDKVRRTVKFLCAVAKGVPIVTTDWLEKSGKAGCFLSTSMFVVKDPDQETKFNFCLKESLKAASSQPLLQGYQIHVTKSVKPEPVHMKDIITSSGATFLPKMPTSHKPQTVVISCEEDLRLCGPAVSASLPIVSAEFILTGILQQKLDFQTHALSHPEGNSQPAGGRGRGRRKI